MRYLNKTAFTSKGSLCEKMYASQVQTKETFPHACSSFSDVCRLICMFLFSVCFHPSWSDQLEWDKKMPSCNNLQRVSTNNLLFTPDNQQASFPTASSQYCFEMIYTSSLWRLLTGRSVNFPKERHNSVVICWSCVRHPTCPHCAVVAAAGGSAPATFKPNWQQL